ncbi:MAG: hypothetical protein ACTTJD_08510, partial [Porphyromonadaceae bacterium]
SNFACFGQQFRPFCFPNSPNLLSNLAHFAITRLSYWHLLRGHIANNNHHYVFPRKKEYEITSRSERYYIYVTKARKRHYNIVGQR